MITKNHLVASLGVQSKVSNDACKAVDDPLWIQHHSVAQAGVWEMQPQSKLVKDLHHQIKAVVADVNLGCHLTNIRHSNAAQLLLFSLGKYTHSIGSHCDSLLLTGK